jgi:hypothetical protein
VCSRQLRSCAPLSPQVINCRLAMLGAFAGLTAELASGKSIIEQYRWASHHRSAASQGSNSPLGHTCCTVLSPCDPVVRCLCARYKAPLDLTLLLLHCAGSHHCQLQACFCSSPSHHWYDLLRCFTLLLFVGSAAVESQQPTCRLHTACATLKCVRSCGSGCSGSGTYAADSADADPNCQGCAPEGCC